MAEVERALTDAAAAHGRHEAEIGKADPKWPDWYAAYMVKEAGVGSGAGRMVTGPSSAGH